MDVNVLKAKDAPSTGAADGHRKETRMLTVFKGPNNKGGARVWHYICVLTPSRPPSLV